MDTSDDGVPQGPMLGQAWFDIFVSSIDSETQYTLSKFVHDSKLCGVTNTKKGSTAIQRDLDRPYKWDQVNLMKFIKANCKVLHVVQANSNHRHRLGRGLYSLPEEWSSPEEDLGI